jgi:predicted ester cyclase
MDGEHNKHCVRRVFEEGWSRGDLAVIDELIAPDGIDEDGGENLAAHSKAIIQEFRAAFPDLTFSVEDLICEGDVVAARVIMRGTHLGPLRGAPPTKKTFAVEQYHFIRCDADGHSISHRGAAQNLELMRQLGLLGAK